MKQNILLLHGGFLLQVEASCHYNDKGYYDIYIYLVPHNEKFTEKNGCCCKNQSTNQYQNQTPITAFLPFLSKSFNSIKNIFRKS